MKTVTMEITYDDESGLTESQVLNIAKDAFTSQGITADINIDDSGDGSSGNDSSNQFSAFAQDNIRHISYSEQQKNEVEAYAERIKKVVEAIPDSRLPLYLRYSSREQKNYHKTVLAIQELDQESEASYGN